MTKTHIRCVRQLSGHGQRGARQPHTHTAVFRVPSGHAVGACLGRAADGAPGAVASPTQCQARATRDWHWVGEATQCQSRATRGKFGSFQPGRPGAGRPRRPTRPSELSDSETAIDTDKTLYKLISFRAQHPRSYATHASRVAQRRSHDCGIRSVLGTRAGPTAPPPVACNLHIRT